MKTLFIINKARRDAGPDDALINNMRDAIQASGQDIEMCLSSSIEETDRHIDAALESGTKALWIGGGDGTLNHALNYTCGHDLVYGIVPMGTVNALAQALKIPPDPLDAVDYLLTATPTPIDIGQVEKDGKKYYFFTYATVGIHAAVFDNIDTRLKKRWGKLAFWESGMRTLWRRSRIPRFDIKMQLADDHHDDIDDPHRDGTIVDDHGYSFTLSNVANYSGFGMFTNEDPLSPGYFELHNFRQNKIGPMLVWYALLKFFGREKSRPASGQILRRVNWINVKANRRLSLQVDGEPLKPKSRKLRFSCVDDGAKLLLRNDEEAKG